MKSSTSGYKVEKVPDGVPYSERRVERLILKKRPFRVLVETQSFIPLVDLRFNQRLVDKASRNSEMVEEILDLVEISINLPKSVKPLKVFIIEMD